MSNKSKAQQKHRQVLLAGFYPAGMVSSFYGDIDASPSLVGGPVVKTRVICKGIE
jgi:hypothetical protein